MSLSSRRRRDRRGALVAALVIAASAPPWVGASAAAADQLDVVAVLPGAGQVSLVAAVAPAPDPVLRPEAFSVTTAAGAALPVRAMPVVSDQLSVAMVVDASAEGAPALPDGRKGAATLLLGLPMTAQVSVVTDADVPTVVAPPASGPKDALAGLDAITPAGGRDTSTALSLALRQLPGTAAAGPRVVVLYTGAPDAGGEAAADLAGRLAKAGVLLAVVTPGAPGPYWSGVARDTGGVVVSTDHGADTAAFDRVAAALTGRYLLVVPTPGPLPATVAVRVQTAAGTLSADAPVPAPAASRPEEGASGPGPVMIAIGLGVLFLAGGAVLPLYARARSRTRRGTGSVGSARPGSAAPRTVPAVPPPAPHESVPAADDAPVPEPAVPAGGGLAGAADPWGSRWDGTPPAEKRPGDPDGPDPAADRPDPAADRPDPAPDSGTLTYADLDAHVARLAADVEKGLRERRQAVAQLALTARDRTDLLDRIIESERRMTRSALDRWPPTATVLDLLSAARRVTSGDAALVGPGGIRVEQRVLRTQDGPRTLLRLSRSDGPVVDHWTVEELARDVDLTTLTEDPRWEHVVRSTRP